MSRCPHCKKRISPLRILSWRWAAYRCPHCRHFSEVPVIDRMLLISVPIGLSLLVFHKLLRFDFRAVALVFVGLAYSIATVFIVSWLVSSFARFRPVVDEKHEH